MAQTEKTGAANGRLRAAYLGSAATGLALVAMGFGATNAYAQDKDAAKKADTKTMQIEEVVVTGSLIRNPNLVRTAPVSVVSKDDMTFKQTNVAEEILRDIPGMVPSIGAQVNNGNGGFSFVNLRGLGSNRNVTLLDGNRVAPSELGGRVDLNNIPIALIDRIDVLTGGASTTYGADAISGVVNFVTKKHFTGVQVDANYGTSFKGDGTTKRVELTMGSDLADGKGNIVLSVGYQKSDPVYQGDRDYGAYALDSYDGSRAGSGLGSYNSRFGNVNPTGTDNGNLVLGGVQPDRTFAAAYTPFNFNPLNVYQTPFQRYNIYTAGTYQITDKIEMYARGMFSKNTVNTLIAPSGSFGDTVQVSLSNPYLSTAQRNAFCAFDTDPTAGSYVPLYTQAECDAAATATSASDPNFRSVTTQLRRRDVEGGPRVSDFGATYFDVEVGLRGDIDESMHWDVMASYGASEQTQVQKGYWLKSRFRKSLMSGPNGCFDQSDGCIPVDFFGPTGSITPEQNAYLLGGESNITTRFDMGQVKGSLSGETGFTMPWAENAVNFAIGGEYRKYTGSQASDLLSQSGDLGGAGGASPNISGGYSVIEGMMELNAPIVENADFAKSLTLEAGLRYSSYKVDADSSPKYQTTTWKLGLNWTPVDDVTFRGTFARAVRAPNIAELFTPQITQLTNLATDPCASLDDSGNPTGNIPTGVVRDVCIAQGAPAGAIGFIPQPAAGQANFTGGGNLNLKPETSNSWTLGMILQPSVVPNLTVTVDYYNIKIDQAITTPAPGDALAACFDNPDPTSAACLAIVRSPIDGSLSGDEAVVKGLPLALSNAGNLHTDGIDFTVNYSHDIGDVHWNSTLTGNWTHRSTFQAVTGVSVNRECVGLYSANCASIQPKISWNFRNTFSLEKFDVSVLWRHIGKETYEDFANGTDQLFEGQLQDLGYANFNKIKAYDYFDLSVRYNVTENVSVTANVLNVFNRRPPIVGFYTGTTAFNSGNTFPSTYDAIGRRFGLNAKVTF
ncbi:TonB-dependent receptor domain-containing protein [Kordiimonas marina]|uniref:TonB-dependent receptor domain-containing protein n=1 Tax=Kordiimonas marina TaxID=2872312 RepID=UPI001FF17C90|nr:TonB-dependent receptor [Kordiimonas marina]MCJ9428471.1 TonB-dependent receptor [Kordiimonas marina]